MTNFGEGSFDREVQCWATLRIGARIDAEQAAKLLGMMPHDIPILVAGGLLQPLGTPVQNSTKWFCAVEIIRLATDRDWLHKATKKLSGYWQTKRANRTAQPGN